VLARLEARQGRGGDRRRKRPASTQDVLDRCYELLGTELTSAEVEIFAKANRIPYARERGRSWDERISAWKESRRARGLPIPDAPPPFGDRPDYTQDIGAARADEQPVGDWTNPDDCVAVVMRYLSQLAPRERSTKRHYDAWVRREGGAPFSSRLDQHGGWNAIRASALQRLAES
jgi:hypothetical protein